MSKTRLEHTPETVSLSDLAKKASSYIARLVEGTSRQLLVLRHNKPAAVVMSIERYEELSRLIEELEDAQDVKAAEQRVGDLNTLDFDRAFDNARPAYETFR